LLQWIQRCQRQQSRRSRFWPSNWLSGRMQVLPVAVPCGIMTCDCRSVRLSYMLGSWYGLGRINIRSCRRVLKGLLMPCMHAVWHAAIWKAAHSTNRVCFEPFAEEDS
jgi:hypothetical protein